MTAIQDILAERLRQISCEGWAYVHDDRHVNGEMAGAAACYALYRSHVPPEVLMGECVLESSWPWNGEWWKPTDRRRDLVKAGALIVAEIDRLDRPAVVRVQGETDSFGCEMIDMCQECVDAERAYRKSDEGKAEAAEAATGTCEWCSGHATDLRDKRDYEEGMSGRVYRVCGACRSRRDAEDAAYLDSYGDWD